MRRRQFLQTTLGATSAAMLGRYAAAQTAPGGTDPVDAATLDGGVRNLSGGALSDLRGVLHPERRINVLFLHGGGAISRTAPGATAFSHRAAAHDMLFVANWPRGGADETLEEVVHRTWARLQPYTRGFYVNDMAGGVSPSEVAANYGPNAARLAAVKARWDPQNLFRLNANITPASPPAHVHT